MTYQYTDTQIQRLLDAYDFTEILELTELTDIEIVRMLLEQSIIDYPQWLTNDDEASNEPSGETAE